MSRKAKRKRPSKRCDHPIGWYRVGESDRFECPMCHAPMSDADKIRVAEFAKRLAEFMR